MCKILISVKPEYVEKILTGSKKYEYRKVKAKKTNIDKMIIYATAPVMKVVAEIEIQNVLEGSPELIWKITQKYSGITKEFYDKYYKNRNTAVAYKLGKIKKYNKPKDLCDFGISFSPQSFIYID